MSIHDVKLLSNIESTEGAKRMYVVTVKANYGIPKGYQYLNPFDTSSSFDQSSCRHVLNFRPWI